MSTDSRDLEAFGRAMDALAPYLPNLVVVGGWAHFLYTLRPEASPLPFEPLLTQDLDVALPPRLPKGETIAVLLKQAGFREILSGSHSPPISEYVLDDRGSGFYVEFLSPLVGGPVKRGGLEEATARISGVTAQALRHLDLLLHSPWSVDLESGVGGRVKGPVTVKIPNPAAYIVQKVLVSQKRRPADRAKDVGYIHDTFLAFSDALPSIGTEWQKLRDTLHTNHVRKFEHLVGSQTAAVTDLLLAAARIAEGRPNAPTPEQLLAALRLGYREAFGITPSP